VVALYEPSRSPPARSSESLVVPSGSAHSAPSVVGRRSPPLLHTCTRKARRVRAYESDPSEVDEDDARLVGYELPGREIQLVAVDRSTSPTTCTKSTGKFADVVIDILIVRGAWAFIRGQLSGVGTHRGPGRCQPRLDCSQPDSFELAESAARGGPWSVEQPPGLVTSRPSGGARNMKDNPSHLGLRAPHKTD
jgi:hypothetical protein